MPNPDKIKCIKSSGEFKYKEKGSVFIGLSFPIETKREAEKLIEEAKKKYYDARHRCHAYKLRTGEEKYSDNGEPSGTAGIRILNAENHFDVTDVLVLVIRYFGGTKLGVGPLGKAYYTAAEGALNNSEFIVKEKYLLCEIHFDYTHQSIVRRIISTYKAKIHSQSYASEPQINCLIPVGYSEKFASELSDKSNGKVKVTFTGESLWLKTDK